MITRTNEIDTISKASIPPVAPATAQDLQDIEAVCRDYVAGWFEADAERMRRALHPDLVKRSIWHNLSDNIEKVTDTLTATAMVGYTANGGGSDRPASEKVYEVEVLDVFRNIATAKVSSYPFMDYLHLAKLNNRWWIVNCLYQRRQGERNDP